VHKVVTASKRRSEEKAEWFIDTDVSYLFCAAVYYILMEHIQLFLEPEFNDK
jgi:hypothetical protein